MSPANQLTFQTLCRFEKRAPVDLTIAREITGEIAQQRELRIAD
jgi:hypothetical protein